MSEKNLKKHNPYRKDYILNPTPCIFEMVNIYQVLLTIKWFHVIKLSIDQEMLMISGSLNFHKKVRYKMDCFILHTVLLVMILLLIIVIIYLQSIGQN